MNGHPFFAGEITDRFIYRQLFDITTLKWWGGGSRTEVHFGSPLTMLCV